MKMRYEKNVRILNYLMGYCNFLGGTHFKIDFEMTPCCTYITVACTLPSLADTQLEEARRLLQIPRQREIEQSYWNVSGEEELDNELSLVGVMTDTAKIVYDESNLFTISVSRSESSGGEPC